MCMRIPLSHVRAILPTSRLNLTICSILLAMGLTYIQLALRQNLHYSDFRVFYSSGYIARTQPKNLYNPLVQEEVQRHFFPSFDFTLLSFVNPPFFSLLFAPLTYLSPSQAFLISILLNVFLYTLVVSLLLRMFPIPKKHTVFAFAIAFSFAPFFTTLLNAQSSVLTLLLHTLFFQTLQRSMIAGLTLSIGIYKPQVVFPTILYALLQKRLGLMIGISLGFLLGLFFSLLLLHTQVEQFVHTVVLYANGKFAAEEKTLYMPSWYGFFTQLQLFIPQVPVRFLTLVASTTTLLVPLRVLTQRKKTPAFSLAVLLVSTVLSGGHIHLHDAVLIVPALFLLIRENSKKCFALAAIGWGTFLLSFFSPLYPYPLFFIPTLYLVGLLWFLLFRRNTSV